MSTLLEWVRPRPRSQRARFLTRWARREVLAKLAQLHSGRLRWLDADGEQIFGPDDDPELQAVVRVQDPNFFPQVAFGGSIGAAEAYLDGTWHSDDLTQVLRLLVRNRDVLNHLEKRWALLAQLWNWLRHLSRANTRLGSQRNIIAHYDLSSDFFAHFLDPRMMYSSAIFDPPEIDLERASEVKLERICRLLDLQPDDHLLEIGTGWGGFALYAATHYGCQVTTTTISPAQLRFVRQKVADAGLDERITVLPHDYRDLTGEFDKLVSIEMIEAVGHQFLPTYVRCASERLKPSGRMLLQAITIADRYYEQAKHSVDFIQRYIFPGSALPSISSLATAIAAASDLTIVRLEDIGLHYARTLRAWRERLTARRDLLRQQGYTEAFLRLFEFYFAYCEAGFSERSISDVQILLEKPGYPARRGSPR